MSYIFDNVILIDYDGVCVTWENAFCLWMMENNYGLPREGFYELHEKYNITEKESRFLSKMFNESAAIANLPPLRDSIKYIRKLHEEHGYVFHCITAVPNMISVKEARWRNIHSLFGLTPFQRLILCDRSANKKEYLSQYKGSECYWIEDIGQNAADGLEFGLKPLLMDSHYNQEFHHSAIPRVKNWKEIYGIITEGL